MENITIHDIDLLELQSDGLFDELSVRIEASAVDYCVSLRDGKTRQRLNFARAVCGGLDLPAPPGSAVTQPGKAGLIEGNCPNCGAAVELNQAANCTHCKALLRSGQYDWVLSEITQEIEWDGERHDDLPGVDEMKSRDPEFNAVELEDRASVIYWRKATADRLGRIDPLRKSASAEFCEAYAPLLRPGPDGRRQSYANCAVGSVRLLGVIPDVAKGDRAIVEVRWSGNRAMLGPDKPPGAYRRTITWPIRSSCSIARGRCTPTRAREFRRPTAPAAARRNPTMPPSRLRLLRAVLNDGSLGWILVDIANREDSRGRRLLAEMNGE